MTNDLPTQPAAALVLFSGGQDSTTCLAWALSRFERVETVGFDYGQRHRVELSRRAGLRDGLIRLSPLWAERLGEDRTISIEALGAISETALTRNAEIAFAADGLPNTFVPGRNLLFLTFAAALAYRRGIADLVGGMCETDYSGYPDCRDQTIRAMAQALSLGMDRSIEHPYAADVDRQGGDLATGGIARRRTAGAAHRRRNPYLLSRREGPPLRLGLWLRRMPRLQAARARLGELSRRTDAARPPRPS